MSLLSALLCRATHPAGTRHAARQRTRKPDANADESKPSHARKAHTGTIVDAPERTDGLSCSSSITLGSLAPAA
eukprot:6244600-Prymnesium_polylepis.1